MKVGILTFHFAHNYGAQLQAYGLSHALCKLGYDCRIIDYRLRYIYRWKERDNIASYFHNQREDGFSWFRSLLRTLRYYPRRQQQQQTPAWDKYDRFMREDLPLSNRIYTWQLSTLKYDALICGSDQVWNIDLTGGVSDAYFLRRFKHGRRIAYAASTGTNGFDFGHLDEIEQSLRTFDALSCRESGLSETVRKMTGRDVATVCDPLFLLSRAEWLKLYVKHSVQQPYLLIYSFNETPEFHDRAKRIAESLRLKIVKISTRLTDELPPESQLCDAGPREFISLFKDAEYVVTNTFHGAATSILLNKQFSVIPPKMRRERIDNLLQIFNLQARFVEGEKQPHTAMIDYTPVNERIERFREESLNFLKQSLDR